MEKNVREFEVVLCVFKGLTHVINVVGSKRNSIAMKSLPVCSVTCLTLQEILVLFTGH